MSLDAFARRGAGVGSWEMIEGISLLLIQICIRKAQKRKKRRPGFLIKVQFYATHKIILKFGIVVRFIEGKEK